jgi:hypothetical protein
VDLHESGDNAGCRRGQLAELLAVVHEGADFIDGGTFVLETFDALAGSKLAFLVDPISVFVTPTGSDFLSTLLEYSFELVNARESRR